MTTTRPVALGLLLLLAAAVPLSAGEKGKARQVTLCGIIATPGGMKVDKRLASVEPQLRKLLPDHGFELLDVRTRRLQAGQSVVCQLGGGGFAAEAILLDPLDANGKVRIKCDLTQNHITQLGTTVSTPPNQLFFCDQKLDDGTHLLIGVGAR